MADKRIFVVMDDFYAWAYLHDLFIGIIGEVQR